jgi:hypothetical protein
MLLEGMVVVTQGWWWVLWLGLVARASGAAGWWRIVGGTEDDSEYQDVRKSELY